MANSKFEDGVKFYTVATLAVPFPEKEVKCQYCPLLTADLNGSRMRCRVNNAIIYNANLTGDMCPLEFGNYNSEENENDQET